MRLPWYRLSIPGWFAVVLLPIGYLLGRLHSPDLSEVAVPRVREARGGSPLLSVTRQLALERRKMNELEERLDDERSARRALLRQSIEFSASDSAWPCGLRSVRTEATRVRRLWCAHADTSEGAPCVLPPALQEYALLTFHPALDSASARIHDVNPEVFTRPCPW